MGALGDHWCVTKEISNFSSALIPPKFIKLNWSIIQYAALPYELEVNLITNPSDIKIEEI